MFNCSLEKKISKKGNEYYVLAIKITETYTKYVFLENAELELVKALNID